MSADAGSARVTAESLGAALRQTARRIPVKTFLRFADTGEATFSDFDALVDSFATGFAEQGIRKGDVVSLLLPNCLEFVACWLGLARIGAVTAATSIALRGAGLAHAFNVAQSRVAVVDEASAAALAAVAEDVPSLERLYVRGDRGPMRRSLPNLAVVGLEELPRAGSPPEVEIEGGDLLMLLFTSGTTGVSKACAISHRYALRQGQIFSQGFGLREDDVYYCPFPLFHGDASIYTVVPAILLGATACLGRRFSVSRFWDEVRSFDATTFDYMGATIALLLKQPESPLDREHRVRLAWGIPLPDFAPRFTERFGVELATGYGLTETGVVVFQPHDEPLPPRAAGKVVRPYVITIVGDDLRTVPAGEIGEILVKGLEPHVVAEGYFGMPDESRETFGGEWVRTGDLGRLDESGFLYFEGRKKDALRRRGQNISAFEIEQAIAAHPSVLETAVCGVDSELTEQDVMAFVVPRPGKEIDPAALVDFCRERMAAFMVPRYVQVIASLPKTPTEKVAKSELAAIGVTETTWDREARR
jgi:crotonobetaine/carnitine-CoA ligase